MPNFLDGLVGGPGNAGQASNNAWNYGQYSPFTVNNPAGQISFNGQNANASLSGPGASLQQGLYGGASQGINAAGNYNPNTSFLPQQYQNIFSPQGFNNGVQNQFQNSVSGIMPFLQQAGASNLDNQFSKGTMASTAGQYQTAGFNQGLGATLSGLQNQAFQNQLGMANSSFGAAQGVAGLGEQQQQFGAQQGLGLLNSSMSGINNQNSFLNQLLQTSGNMGAQRSGANVAAATPGIQTGSMQDQAQAGLLSGLLFGGGANGGLLGSLLGSNGTNGGLGSMIGGLGGLIGKGAGALGNLFGGSSGGDSSGGYTNPGTGGTGWAGDTQSNFNMNGSQDGASGNGGNGPDSGTTTWFGDGGFSGAGGQAANGSGMPNVSELGSVQNAVNQGPGTGPSQGSLGGALGSLAGLATGIAKGGASGYGQAAGNAGKLYNQVTGNSGGFAGSLGQVGSALNIYNGLTSGTPQGTVSGLASGAGLAASSGAASGLGASAGTVAALGTAATGIGAVLAIPSVVNGVGDLVFGNLLGMNKPDKYGNEISILRNKGGVTSTNSNTASGGGLGSATSGGSTGQMKTYYQGKDITKTLADPAVVQKASDFLQAGDMAGYKAYMSTLNG